MIEINFRFFRGLFGDHFDNTATELGMMCRAIMGVVDGSVKYVLKGVVVDPRKSLSLSFFTFA